ncbi:sensor histidine kinase [Micromonospora sp. NPDC048063]|uniref:sensor histidine kinase n=1 Tax=Micromonospora sp. NPDC048063 TaxID=3364256 RepID=UPI003718D639
MGLHDRLSRPADVGLGVLSAALLALQAVAIAQTWGGGYWQFDCAAGAVTYGIVLLRRRHPAGAAVAGLAVAATAILVARLAHLPAEPSPAMVLILSVLVGSAVRALNLPLAGAVAAAGLAVVAGTRLAFPGDSGSRAVTSWNAAGWLAAVALGLGLRLLDARGRAVAEQVRRDERMSLARELHDVVAHHVTGIVLQAQAAQLVAGKRPEALAGVLSGIEQAGSDALAAMRRVVTLLRDSDDAPPVAVVPERLSELVNRFGGHGPTVRLRMPDGEPEWPPEVTSTVYRIVQESLTNISRHAAHAHSVMVTVTQDRSAITVEVADDGRPVRPRPHHLGGYGLVGMRERVEALGGTLRAGPREGSGWCVHATLPVPTPEPR